MLDLWGYPGGEAKRDLASVFLDLSQFSNLVHTDWRGDRVPKESVLQLESNVMILESKGSIGFGLGHCPSPTKSINEV